MSSNRRTLEYIRQRAAALVRQVTNPSTGRDLLRAESSKCLCSKRISRIRAAGRTSNQLYNERKQFRAATVLPGLPAS